MAYEKVKYLYPTKGGRWKYLRDVPRDLQDLLYRKRWDFSLGSDRTIALQRWALLIDKHDRLIKRLDNDDGKEEYIRSEAYEDAVYFSELLRDYETEMSVAFDGREVVLQDSKPTPASAGWIRLEGRYEEDPPKNMDLWRSTEDILRSTENAPDIPAYDRLANFAAVAFGDTSFLLKNRAFAEANLEHSPPKRPEGASGVVYDALGDALRKRLRLLSPAVTPDAPDRIMKFYEVFAAHKGHRELTRVDYEKKLSDFVNNVGDLRIGEITKEHLRDYRDSLSVRMNEVSSVVGYMVPIKALLAHAFSEDRIPSNPAAGLKMPTDPKTIEERKHLHFTPGEVRMIFDKANDVWADENKKSRLSLGRRRLYRLTLEALLHTGARPHELWRLLPENVGTHEEHDWPQRGIDIQNTKIGKRLIPCPHKALPFIDFVQTGGLKDLNAETDREIGNRTKAFSGERQFDKILIDLKIKRPRISLYSTRATFVTSLQSNGYSDGLIENIIGHVGSARMLRHYKSRAEMTDMLAAMNSVLY